jgi:hypothetical protein
MKALLENPQVVEALLEILSTVVALALAATPLLLRWFKAQGVAIDDGQAKQIDIIARQAAAYAEEWARARIKGGAAPAGDEKLAIAIGAAKNLATGTLSKLAEEKWGVAIQAKLPELRATVGASIPPLDALPPLQ